MVGERERWKEGEIGRAGQTFPQRLAELRGELDSSLAAAKEKHATALALVTEQPRQTGREQSQRICPPQCGNCGPSTTATGRRSAIAGGTGLAELNEAWDRIYAECERLFPDWNVNGVRIVARADGAGAGDPIRQRDAGSGAGQERRAAR